MTTERRRAPSGLAPAGGQPLTIDNWNIVAGAPPECPARPPAEGAPAPSPREVAEQYWQEVPLPSPRPHIAPGRAITGKTAYLETRGETSHTYERDTPLGRLQLQARGEYYVDWGDGTTSGPYPFEGEPWPDGRITHVYLDVGTYDVVVTQRWSAPWTLGGDSGTVSGLRTTGRIDDFPVEQIQAVLDR